MEKRIGTSNDVPMIRMAHPHAFATFLRQSGAPTDAAYMRVGLPSSNVTPDAYVPVNRVRLFLDEMAPREGVALGWEIGRWARENNLHPGLLRHLAVAPNLERALKDLIPLARVEYSHLQLGMTVTGEDVNLWVRDSIVDHTPGYYIGASYLLWVIIGIIRRFTGTDWEPNEIGIEARQVPEVARNMLPNTYFVPGAKLHSIRFPRFYLNRPPQGGWALEQNRSTCDSMLTLTNRLEFSGALRLLMESYLQENRLTADGAAGLIGISSRTLRRRLEREGLTYSEVLDRVRFDAAQVLLSDGKQKIVDIAYALGFTDPSHFARSFRRIFGICPTEYRRIRAQSGCAA